MGALRRAKPVVCVPLGSADHVPNAQRLNKIGAGISIFEHDRTPEAIADALTHVLDDDSYTDAARGAADEIALLPPSDHAASLLEQLATTRQPIGPR